MHEAFQLTQDPGWVLSMKAHRTLVRADAGRQPRSRSAGRADSARIGGFGLVSPGLTFAAEGRHRRQIHC